MSRKSSIIFKVVLMALLVVVSASCSKAPTSSTPATSTSTSVASSSSSPTKTSVASTSAASASSATEVKALPKVNLRLTHQFLAGTTSDKVSLLFESLATKYTNGALTFTHYNEGEIYPNYVAMVKGTFAGEVDMVLASTSGFVTAGVSDLNILATWGLFEQNGKTSAELINAFWKSPVGGDLIEKQIEQKGGIVLTAYPDADPNILFATKQPLKSIYDLKGLKIKGGPGSGNRLFLDEIGATYVNLPTQETYVGVQTGVADAASGSMQSMVTLKLYEVLPCISNYSLYASVNFLSMNLKKWQSLPPEMQKIITDKVIPEVQAAAPGITSSQWAQYIDTVKSKANFYDLPKNVTDEIESIYPDYWDKVGKELDLTKYVDAVKSLRK